MGEYCKPWQRKLGIVTLLCACLMLGGWVRSTSMLDRGVHSSADSIYGFTSVDGNFYFVRLNGVKNGPRFSWQVTQKPTSPVDYWHNFKPRWRWEYAGFDCGTGMNTKSANVRLDLISITYWAIVVPLAILSSWLLLRRAVLSPTQASSRPSVID